MRTLRALIVGKGTVGKELGRQLTVKGWTVVFSQAYNNMVVFLSELESADVVFICISTKDKGECALQYILSAVHAEKCVVTCEKGALAYHYETLKQALGKNTIPEETRMRLHEKPRIAFTATVGGGSGIAGMFSPAGMPRPKKITGFINGTVNYLSWAMSERKMSPEDALVTALKKGLPEKSSTNILDAVNAELDDVSLKLALLVNFSGACGLGHSITPDCLGTFMLQEDTALELLSNPNLRFMVVISEESPCDATRLQVHTRERGIHIVATFLDPRKHYGGKVIPRAEGNALHVEDYLGRTYEKWGLGAGPGPTAATMVIDAERMAAIHGLDVK